MASRKPEPPPRPEALFGPLFEQFPVGLAIFSPALAVDGFGPPLGGRAGIVGGVAGNVHLSRPIFAGAQCPEAPEAPMPVSERTCCAANPARSIRARGPRSVIEKSQMPTKASVIENSAGEV